MTRIGTVTRYDKLVGEFFPTVKEFGAPYAGEKSLMEGSRKFTAPGEWRDEVVTEEGTLSPYNSRWVAQPPKNPPGRIDDCSGYESIVQAIEDHNAFIVIAVEEDANGGIPAGFEGMTRDEPMTQEKYEETRDGLVQICDPPEYGTEIFLPAIEWWWLEMQMEATPKDLLTFMRQYA